jgi:hypothetical protein
MNLRMSSGSEVLSSAESGFLLYPNRTLLPVPDRRGRRGNSACVRGNNLAPQLAWVLDFAI